MYPRSTRNIPDVELPLTDGAIESEAIEKSRQDAIGYVLQMIYQRLENPRHHGCCDDCDQLFVGTLTRQLQTNRLYPRPTAPFHGYNVDQLVRFLNAVPEPRCNTIIHPFNGCLMNCVLLPELDRAFFDTLENIIRMITIEFPLGVE